MLVIRFENLSFELNENVAIPNTLEIGIWYDSDNLESLSPTARTMNNVFNGWKTLKIFKVIK